MRILHAFWTGEIMQLWLEEPSALTSTSTSTVTRTGTNTRARSRRPKTHPFTVRVNHLTDALAQLLNTDTDEAGEDTLWLPTAHGQPLPSNAQDDAQDGGTFAPWTVDTVLLHPAHAALALGGLPAHLETVVLGADTVAWSAAGRWVLALASRERAVPSVTADGTASWLAVLDDPQDQFRLNAIAAALPLCARRSQDGTTVPQARACVIDFVHKALDGYIGGVTHDRPATVKPPSRWPEESRAWADALKTGGTVVRAGKRTLQRFAAEIDRWTTPLRGSGGAPPPFRTCFRLEPPASAKPSNRRSWTVQILTQAADDPSLLQPAASLWSRKGAPADRLLADLGRAVRVFPTLSRALAETRPTALPLAHEEAATFLRDTSWMLEESGFGVLLPGDRLLRGDVQVTLRARPKRQRSTSRGLLGLDAIVDYDWALSLGDSPMSVEEFRRLAHSKVPLVEIRGQWVLLDAAQVERTLQALGGVPQTMTLREAVAWATREDVPNARLSLEGPLAALADPARLDELDAPAALQGQLRPYQRRGFSWMAFLTARGLGACLADDMGLGKTIQLITLLLHRAGTSLIICPTSLVGNWQRELGRFAPSLRVGIHHGTDRKKKTLFPKWARGFDVVLTTYALAARDEETLAAVSWDVLAIDEAQNVKNPDARQSRSVRRLASNCRVAMSGTPVENRLTDLWSIMDFLNPGLLGSREAFRRRFVVPVERWGDRHRAAQLRSAVGPFVLRRVKTDPTIISDLPEKQEMKVYCPLTREQATLYQATVDDMLAKIEGSEGIQRHGLVLKTMLRLKQICDHPALFLDDGSPLAAPRSGKLQRLEEMLEEVVSAGDRALVFSQFSTLGEKLQRELSERLLVPVLFLCGDTPRAERDKMVERFQTDDGPPIFVLSVKAGGVGLNLTRASHVFHFDRWWNPAVENQATDRAFRIGQRRNVQVHKFICQGTLEEAIDALIESKLVLADQAVGSGESWLAELDTKQLRRLFTLQAGAVEEDE